MSRHFTSSRKFVKGGKCDHDWIFIRALHIKCIKCRVTAVRRPSKAEMQEFKDGKWIVLGPRRG